jgi:nicotinamidase-related amidase
MNLIEKKEAVLAVIDVQGRLAEVMFERDRLFSRLETLIQGARILGLPILWTEQVPEKLGPTTPRLRELLEPQLHPLSKSTFSCLLNPEFRRRLEELGRRTVLLSGIESHVCVYQTAADLVRAGYRVEVVADAVSSRSEANRAAGLRRIEVSGARLTTTEMVLLELQRTAEGEAFRRLVSLIR